MWGSFFIPQRQQPTSCTARPHLVAGRYAAAGSLSTTHCNNNYYGIHPAAVLSPDSRNGPATLERRCSAGNTGEKTSTSVETVEKTRTVQQRRYKELGSAAAMPDIVYGM